MGRADCPALPCPASSAAVPDPAPAPRLAVVDAILGQRVVVVASGDSELNGRGATALSRDPENDKIIRILLDPEIDDDRRRRGHTDACGRDDVPTSWARLQALVDAAEARATRPRPTRARLLS